MAEAKKQRWKIFAHVEGGVLLGAGAVTAVAAGLPLFGALGALGYALISLNKWRQSRAETQERAPFLLDPPDYSGLGVRWKVMTQEGHKAAQDVLDQIAAAPADVRDFFDKAQSHVRSLYQQHTQLVRRAWDISRHLDGIDVANIQRQREEAARRLRATSDPMAQKQFQSAIDTHGQSLESHAEMQRDVGRIDGQLAAIRAALESARMKVLRVGSAEARGAASEGEQMAESLRSLGAEVDVLNRTVDEVYVGTASPARSQARKETT